MAGGTGVLPTYPNSSPPLIEWKGFFKLLLPLGYRGILLLPQAKALFDRLFQSH